MRRSITEFLERVCKRYGLSATYRASDDVYLIHFRGYAIQNFRGENFHDIPPRARERMLLPLLKRGLAHNIGERSLKHDLNIHSQHGQRIVTSHL